MPHPYKYAVLSLLLLFAVTTPTSQAQTPQITYQLENDESGATKTYVARDQIVMKPGFKFQNAGSNTFTAKIDAGLLFPPTENTYALPNGEVTTDPTQGAVVGSIPGTGSIDLTGNANYIIPVEVPIGINGMQPSLSIMYNSNAGYGVLGYRWDVNGISSIDRTTQNFYFDETNGKTESNSIKFDNTDRLSLDGQRLILINDEQHFTDGAKYATEIENYSIIEIKTSIETNQIYFEITTKEGKVFEYGKTNNSLIKKTEGSIYKILSWRLNKVTDVYGNYILYKYCGSYLKEIEYTGTSTANPAKKIILNYEQNTFNPRKQYIQNFEIKSDSVLKEIVTYSNNYELRKYQFTYYNNKKLRKIDLTTQNSEKVNSTNINWGTESMIQKIPDLGNVSDNTFFEKKGSSMYFADFNGDGYQDMIQLWEGDDDNSGNVCIFLYNKTTNKYPSSYNYRKVFAWNSSGITYPLLTADIDNDGMDEVLLFHIDFIFTLNYNDGEMDVSSVPYDGNLLYSYQYPYPLLTHNGFIPRIINLNNDVYPDVVVLPLGEYDSFNKYSNTFYGSPNGLVVGSRTLNSVEDCRKGNAKIEIGDFNADNIGDIMVFGANSNFNNSYIKNLDGVTIFHDPGWSTLVKDARRHLTYDFNNDGLTDMIFQDDNNCLWKFVINTGGYNSFQTSNLTLFHNSSDATDAGLERDNAHILDFNGDGLMDVVIADETFVKDTDWHWLFNPNDYDFANTTWYFYKNINGTSFELFGNPIVSTERLPKTQPNIADINNDGIQDLVLINASKIYAYSIINGNRNSLVKEINNGMNQTIQFGYSNYLNYNQSSTSYPIRNIKSPLLVATTFTDIDGNAINYVFEDAKAHVKGKGFLGFSKITASSQLKNTKTVSHFQINPNFYSVNLSNQTISTYNGNTISTLTQINSVKVVDAVRKRYIPIVNSQTSTDHLRGITSVSENIHFDDYGNVTQSKTTLGGIVSATTNTTYKPRISGKVPYLPDNVTVIKQGGTGTSTRTVICNYNAYGNIIKEIKDFGDENEVSTEYEEFNQWGYPTKIKITANGKIRNSSLTYTDSGYFIKTKTNNLNETTTYYWNETTGLLDSEKDHWEKQTYYKYNKWGQLEETIYPNGNRSLNKLQWADAGNTLGAKYYSYSQMSGSAPVWTWYDSQGRRFCNETLGLNGNKISVLTDYYPDGRVQYVYEPTFDVYTSIENTTYIYDEYGRTKKITTPMGETTYTYADKTITVTSPEGSSETTVNNAGQTIINKVNGKAVFYTYYATGLTHTATPEGGQPITMYYDLQGNRIKLDDPDAGIIESKYDGFGNLLWEKQQVHNATQYVTTTNNYDDETGLLNSVQQSGKVNELTSYTYDSDLGHKSRIKSIEITGQRKQIYSYDALGRVNNVKEEIDGRSYNTATEYDALGRIKKEIYPTGYYTVNTYDEYGNKIQVKDRAGRIIWQAVHENARGQLTEIVRGGKTTIFEYDDRGFMTSIYTPGIVDQTYSFDYKGNLHYRMDNLTNQKEMFGYDPMNRLTNWDIYQNGSQVAAKQNSITYNNMGNIERKSDLGNLLMKYGAAGKPHALDSIIGIPTLISLSDLNVTYTDFKKIKTLTEGDKTYTITYGVDNQRRKSEYIINGVIQKTKYYLGDYEEETDNLGNIKKIHYLSGGAILIINNGVETLYYGYNDYQGSLITLANEADTIVERYAYDPWGVRRNPLDWTQTDVRTTWIVNRGYTMHEHLDAFSIINMNGRVYDPLTAMFFSPDPYVQAPENWLNYNRYSYVMNNPLKYTDPSGNLFIIPTVSYSYYGGLSVGVSAGLGLPGGASVGGSVSYNFRQQNWTFTVNASLGGLYSYAGYDTKAGIVAGAGFGFQSVVAGNFSFPTNMFGASINYSQSGGLSLSMFGFNMGSNGIVFDPSITASVSFRWGSEFTNSEGSLGVTTRQKSPIQSQEEMEICLEEAGHTDGNNKIESVQYENTEFAGMKGYKRDADGVIWFNGKKIAGVTKTVYSGLKIKEHIIYMSPHASEKSFFANFNHELIHVYHHNKYGMSIKDRKEFKNYTEKTAHYYTSMIFPDHRVPASYKSYNGNLSVFDLPRYLIPLP